MITLVNEDSIANITRTLRYREKEHEELIDCMRAYLRLENNQELKAYAAGERIYDYCITPDIRKSIMNELEARINVLREGLGV